MDIIIEELRKETEDSFVVVAYIGVEPFASKRQESQIGKWVPDPGSGMTRYFIPFKKKVDYELWQESIQDLQYLIASCFFTDYSQRELLRFEVLPFEEEQPTESQVISQAKLFFGHYNYNPMSTSNEFIKEEGMNHKQNSQLSNYGFKKYEDKTYIYKEFFSDVEKNYKLFKKENWLFKNIFLIQEAFRKVNESFSRLSFPDERNLISGVILMVAALENLLLKEKTSEAQFKFCLMGAILYEKNVSQSDLDEFTYTMHGKLTFNKMRKLLKSLYDVRSDFAHGSMQSFIKKQKWITILEHLNVSTDTSNYSFMLKQFSLAMVMLQMHIMALIKTSLADLGKNIDDIMDYMNVKPK